MDLTARSARTDKEPSMRRSFLLSKLKSRITVNNETQCNKMVV